jgi:predicted acetyltransferase
LDLDYKKLSNDFDTFVQGLLDQEKGVNLPKGYVPATVLWLVDTKNNQYLGRISIRHSLTKKLMTLGGHIGYEINPLYRRKGYGKLQLKLALPVVKKLGVKKALITCDEDNIGSKKIIESCGGVFESKFNEGKNKPKKLRYWINIKN